MNFLSNKKVFYRLISREKEPQAYILEDKDIQFEIGIEISDDVLIRCRNFESNDERTSIFRILFTPCLTFGEEVKLYKVQIFFF